MTYSSSTQEESKQKPPSHIESFMSLAHKRFRLAENAENHVRNAALDDLRFRSGDQWPEDIKVQRSKDGRPCLVMDRIEQFVRQICNEERQQRPTIQVNPVGSGADVETAEVIQGICRHIDVQSHADIARDHAFEMMVTIGFGYYRLLIAEDDLTGELEIYVKRIKNPFTVYFDPNSQEPDYSDARWCFILQDLSPEDYKAEYAETSLSSLTDYLSVGDAQPNWITKEFIRVAEYFYIEGQGKDRKVKWAKINAIEAIEGGPDDEVVWQGKWIPVFPVLGIDLDVNGTRYLAGLVRKLKDPQRQYNYMTSAITESIALESKSKWLVAEGQIENYEQQWKQQNNRYFSALTYKLVDISGRPAPPPQQIDSEAQIGAMVEALQLSNDDLQAAAGLYNPSLGAPSADHSGKAILARQKQGDIANLNWTDNLSRTIWHEGRCILDLIPKVYDRERIMRIINPDGSVRQVGITNTAAGAMEPEEAAEMLAVPRVYDVGLGSYDLTVSTGPSYQSKRQEAVVTQMALMQTLPNQAPLIAPTVVSNMDIPGAKEIAKILQQALPPQFQEQNGSPESQLQQLQAQNQQMQGILQQQAQIVQQQHQMLEGKMLEQQTKKEIEMARIQADLAGKKLQYETQLAVAQINASKDAHEAYAQRELETLGMAHDAAHETALAAMEHQRAMELGAQAAMQQEQEQPNG